MSEFIDFLYQHFPHRWLNKKSQGTEKLFTGLCKSLDYGAIWVNIIKNNNSVQTADEIITELENEYGLTVNPSYDIEFRRKRIAAKMRIQDSPVTKNDLINMIEALGFNNCSIRNELNKYVMNVKFDMPDDFFNKVPEAVKLLNENVRAHIEFLIYVLIALAVKNQCDLSLHNMIISAYVRNLDLDYIILDGTRLLDGSWRLITMSRAVRLNKFTVLAMVKSNENISWAMELKAMGSTKEVMLLKGMVFKSSLKTIEIAFNNNFKIKSAVSERFSTEARLTTNTIWNLNGSYTLGGSKKLNAEIKEMIL